MQRLHAQNHPGQAGAQNFRLGVGGALVEIIFGIQPETDTGRHPATAPGTLIGCGAGDGLDLQLLDLVAMRVTLDARQPGVDHIAYARHGE